MAFADQGMCGPNWVNPLVWRRVFVISRFLDSKAMLFDADVVDVLFRDGTSLLVG